MNVTDLTRDTLFLLALELDVPDLLNLCKTYSKIDDLICQRKDIWIAKLKPFYSSVQPEDIFLDVKSFRAMIPNSSVSDIYSLIYSLNVIKQFLNQIDHQDKKRSLVELYNLRELSLFNKGIQEIPKELGNLTNLQMLSLSQNQMHEIPKELGNLINLQDLRLSSNQIQEIPKELGNLTNLKHLYLYNTHIPKIPKEVTSIKGISIYK